MRRSYEGTANPFYGKTHSQGTKEKLKQFHLGTHLSEETLSKLRSKIPWNKGKIGVQICSEETREKHRINLKKRDLVGDKNPAWKNGITADKEYWLQYCNAYRAKKRILLLDFLGGKCARCGFTDYRALQIDHINGGGLKELKEIGNHGVYKNVYMHPEKYQVLCANCNWIKKVENKENANVYARKGILAEKKIDVTKEIK